MTPEALIKSTSPKSGEKYSPKLNAWLAGWVRRYGKTVEAIPGVFRGSNGTLWIGMLHDADNSLIGCRLIGVLCNGARETTANHINERNLERLPTFWDDYIRDGRCAIDTEHQQHFLGSDGRWKTTGDVRECQWCGHHVQVQLSWTETRTITKTEWVTS